MSFRTILWHLLCAQGLGKCCQCLLLFQGLWCRAVELLLGTVELFQIAPGQEVICLRTSTGLGSRFRSEETVGTPGGTHGGVQWMRAPEWLVDSLNAPALTNERIYGHLCVFWSPTKPPLKPLSFPHYPIFASNVLTTRFALDVRCDSRFGVVPEAFHLVGEALCQWRLVDHKQSLAVRVSRRVRPVEASSYHGFVVDHGELVVQLVATGKAGVPTPLRA